MSKNDGFGCRVDPSRLAKGAGVKREECQAVGICGALVLFSSHAMI